MDKPILYIDMDGVVIDFPEVEEEIPAVIREKCIEWHCKSKHHSDFLVCFLTFSHKDGAIETIYFDAKIFHFPSPSALG